MVASRDFLPCRGRWIGAKRLDGWGTPTGVFGEAEAGDRGRAGEPAPVPVSASRNARPARPIRLGFAEPPSPTGKEKARAPPHARERVSPASAAWAAARR